MNKRRTEVTQLSAADLEHANGGWLNFAWELGSRIFTPTPLGDGTRDGLGTRGPLRIYEFSDEELYEPSNPPDGSGF